MVYQVQSRQAKPGGPPPGAASLSPHPTASHSGPRSCRAASPTFPCPRPCLQPWSPPHLPSATSTHPTQSLLYALTPLQRCSSRLTTQGSVLLALCSSRTVLPGLALLLSSLLTLLLPVKAEATLHASVSSCFTQKTRGKTTSTVLVAFLFNNLFQFSFPY